MKFSFFGFEIEIGREEKHPFNRWECRECGEWGWFPREEGKVWTSGFYNWRSYPEMRCECRRHHEEANK